MAGWCHRTLKYSFGRSLRFGARQTETVFFSSSGHKESEMTEWYKEEGSELDIFKKCINENMVLCRTI